MSRTVRTQERPKVVDPNLSENDKNRVRDDNFSYLWNKVKKLQLLIEELQRKTL